MALSTHSNWSAAVATFITVLTERPVDPAVVAFVVVIRVLTMLVQGRRAALLWAGIEIVMMLVMASTWYLDWQPHWLPTAGAAVPCASLLLAVRVRHLQLRDRHS